MVQIHCKHWNMEGDPHLEGGNTQASTLYILWHPCEGIWKIKGIWTVFQQYSISKESSNSTIWGSFLDAEKDLYIKMDVIAPQKWSQNILIMAGGELQ